MTALDRYSRLSRPGWGIGLWPVIFLVALTFPVWGGFRIPAELNNASEEQQREYIQIQSQLGLHEKIRVGEQRYQQRLAARKAMVEDMRARIEERKEMIFKPAEDLPAPKPGPNQLILAITLLLFVGGILLVRHWRRKESDGITLASLILEELKSPTMHLLRAQPRPALEPAAANAATASATTAPRAPGPIPPVANSRDQRLGRVQSLRVCLDVSPEAREFVSEDSIREQVRSVLQQSQIRIEEKSTIWLTLTVSGEWDDKSFTFTHREDLTLLESVTLIREGFDMQTTFVNLWGGGYTDFAQKPQANSAILEAVQQITGLFTDALLTVREKARPA